MQYNDVDVITVVYKFNFFDGHEYCRGVESFVWKNFLSTGLFFQPKKSRIVSVDDEGYGWVDPLKEALQKCPDVERVWLIARNPFNGVIGMVNCLRQEEGGNKLR